MRVYLYRDMKYDVNTSYAHMFYYNAGATYGAGIDPAACVYQQLATYTLTSSHHPHTLH